tara:strand:+ start:1950 stop:3017 length:1068 start_codon:yes stop_codon:yes gene_type:complete
MSTLLEQAIVDATALKEAALKSAENSILEKYAPEVKKAIDSLLEQDELDFGDEMGDEGEALDAVPLAAAEEAPLCPCPDDDEEIEIDFDQLQAMMDEMPAEDAAGNMAVADLGVEAGQDEDEELELTEAILEAIESEEPPQLEEEAEEEDLEEDIEITEDNIDAILEELVVDINPQKSGWAGTPESVMNHNAELKLAQMASTEAQEEIKTMKQALGNIKKDYAQMNERFEKAQSKNKRLVETLSGMKEALEKVQLSNARLFYTNRVLNSSSLNERQKSKIAEAISDSRSVNEAKVIYETLQSAVGTSSTKKGPKSLSEAVNRNSPLMARRKESSSSPNNSSAVERMQRLAGISNK